MTLERVQFLRGSLKLSKTVESIVEGHAGRTSAVVIFEKLTCNSTTRLDTKGTTREPQDLCPYQTLASSNLAASRAVEAPLGCQAGLQRHKHRPGMLKPIQIQSISINVIYFDLCRVS